MTGLANESNVMKIITGIIMALLIWSGTTILSLSASDGMQELHIQNGIEAEKTMITNHGLLSERVARLESELSGLKVALSTIIKNQDWMREKLESK